MEAEVPEVDSRAPAGFPASSSCGKGHFRWPDKAWHRTNQRRRVRHLHAEALEELLIDGVEELLLLREVGDGGGGLLHSEVEAVELLQKVGPAEALGGEGINDLLDFGGDNVAAGEVGVVEDGAEQALGEQVLDEHFLDGGISEIGIDGAPGEFRKVGKRFDETPISLALPLDDFNQAAGEFGHAVLKLGDGALPFGVGGRRVAEEGVERVNEGGRLGKVGVEGHAVVLEGEGAARGWEEDVVAGGAEGEFLRSEERR